MQGTRTHKFTNFRASVQDWHFLQYTSARSRAMSTHVMRVYLTTGASQTLAPTAGAVNFFGNSAALVSGPVSVCVAPGDVDVGNTVSPLPPVWGICLQSFAIAVALSRTPAVERIKYLLHSNVTLISYFNMHVLLFSFVINYYTINYSEYSLNNGNSYY